MTDEPDEFILRTEDRQRSWLLFVVLGIVAVIAESGSARIVAAILCPVFAVVFARSLRTGVRCDRSGGVAVDEVGLRTRLTWTDIDHFEERELRGIDVVKKSGQWVRLTTYATLGNVSPEMATAQLEVQRKKFQETER